MPHEAPVGWAAFHDIEVTVTLAPDCVQLPDQPWSACWVPAKANVRVQLVSGSPRFCSVRLAPNPLPLSHAFVYVTWHPAAAEARVGTMSAVAAAAVVSAASRATRYRFPCNTRTP